jgi:phage terminase small subunit
MPRKSQAAHNLDAFLRVVQPKPLEPPADLGESEKRIWQQVVRSLPAGFIQASATALLSAYCSHVATAQAVAAALRGTAIDSKDYPQLVHMMAAEDKVIIALARALRLTPHSQLTAERARDAFTARETRHGGTPARLGVVLAAMWDER